MSRRNKWVLALMLLLGIAIFAFSLRDIKFSVLINDFVNINFWWFGVAILCLCFPDGFKQLLLYSTPQIILRKCNSKLV